jgi:hypothetical protein
MIILGAHVGSLAEYIDAGGEIEISRPEKCPGCQGVRTFWKHTSYWRSVIEGDIEAQVRVPRFRCKVRSCKLVVSVMLGFLIPYIESLLWHFHAALLPAQAPQINGESST